MPTTVRKRSSAIRITYRSPFDWPALLSYLGARATPGVELVDGDTYWRTVRVGDRIGTLAISHDEARRVLVARYSPALAPARDQLRLLVRRTFDHDTDVGPIVEHLATDVRLAPLVRQRPGLRIPGAASGFELAVRAILGQQVSVKGASTLAGRLAASVGEPLPISGNAPRQAPSVGLTHLAPTADRIADAGIDRIARIGLPRSRAATLTHLARAVADGLIGLEPGPGAGETANQLLELPGVGPWTAQYIALRALRLGDAFPESDLGLRKAMGGLSAIELRLAAERWRPWRGFAAIHLWIGLSSRQQEGT